MSETPAFVKIKAIDVKPYRWALWCSFEGGESFANPIVHRVWDDDGQHILFGLDSHNGYLAHADDVLELVPCEIYSGRDLGEIDRKDAERMAVRPTKGEECPLCGQPSKEHRA